MFDDAFGLPLHVLVIHAVVVFVPLTVLAALVYAVVPRSRWILRWPLLAGAVICLGSGFVARESGEAFFDRLNEPPQVVEHADLGHLLFWIILAFFVVTVAAVFLLSGPSPLTSATGRAATTRPLQLVIAVLLVVVALGAGVQVVRTGDAGARATWGSGS